MPALYTITDLPVPQFARTAPLWSGEGIIDFWMRWRDIDFKTAVKELADMLL
jgi:hypothetical protein